MNLGAFLDPEYPIFSTTLCYLEREDAYLMLHRIKKQDDYNHDKWVGVGGKFERFESPEECLVREVREETGLTLTRYRARGLLTFVLGSMTEFIHLYTADRWEGEMVQGDACREGVLEWVPKQRVTALPIWEGDKIFFRLLNENRPYFSLKLVYEGDTLTQAVLDGEQFLKKTVPRPGVGGRGRCSCYEGETCRAACGTARQAGMAISSVCGSCGPAHSPLPAGPCR